MASAHQPNILWISLEDTSPRFGCYGDDVAQTPNIDSIAADGRVYTEACATAGVCAPSRASVITGCHQTAIGTHHMRTKHMNEDTPKLPTPYSSVPPHYVTAFPEFLRAAGYYCTNNSKTDYQFDNLGESQHDFDAPVSIWDENHKDAHWRNRPDDDQPFFAVFNPIRTHESGMWEEGLVGVNGEPETDPDAVDVPPYLPDTNGVRKAIARQYDNIARSDEEVGRLLRELREDGLADDTIVFIWSDHGEGLPRAKRSLYDSGINVPLVVRWPGEIEGGERSQRLVSLLDLGPTVLSLAGVDIPTWMQGRPFLGPGADEPRESLLAARDRIDESYDMVRAIRTDQYKYIRNYDPTNPPLVWVPFRARGEAMQDLLRLHAEGELDGPAAELLSCDRPVEELYDVAADPHEIDNLADDPAHSETLAELRAVMDDRLDAPGDRGHLDETQMVEQMWPGGEQPVTETPTFVPNAPENRMTAATPTGGEFTAPTTVTLHCDTQGASIVYATGETDDSRWKLYTTPIELDEGETTIRTKAIRYGYEESDVRAASFTVN
ncbi:sulfatase-like hydrolase/transferase [Haloferax sp. Atlit-48N]|uniref:Sulfatase-like hydrolase/transferase n=1 Tax=Haloferax sp. Atlit-48N TaxID=2077198 RepID=A0ACD5HY41_9EURY|nr:sulfatase-like hydrolase/transferase [Haloferax sp. Atlit-48N]RDZ31183.1 sulfatase [Haloferax sp. Atlit-48N]